MDDVKGLIGLVGSPTFNNKIHVQAIHQVRVQGKTPLMMHRMDEETLDQLYDRANKTRKELTKEQKANQGIYRRESDNRIVMPVGNLRACLVEAGRKVEYSGKTMISNKEATLLDSAISFVDEYAELMPDHEPNGAGDLEHKLWTVDIRRGLLRNGANKTAVPIVRAKFPKEWYFDVTIHQDMSDAKFGVDKLRELFAKGGRMVGLCSFRPACRGNFGMFYAPKEEWHTVYLTESEYEDACGLLAAK